MLTIASTAETVVPPIAPTTKYRRNVEALRAACPGTLPLEFLGKVLKPHERVRAMVEVTYGQTAADALDGLIRPNSKIDRLLARRMLDALFPATRPIQLELPDATTPDALDRSFSIIRAAWTSGRITIAEAEGAQRLVRAQYRASVTARADRL